MLSSRMSYTSLHFGSYARYNSSPPSLAAQQRGTWPLLDAIGGGGEQLTKSPPRTTSSPCWFVSAHLQCSDALQPSSITYFEFVPSEMVLRAHDLNLLILLSINDSCHLSPPKRPFQKQFKPLIPSPTGRMLIYTQKEKKLIAIRMICNFSRLE